MNFAFPAVYISVFVLCNDVIVHFVVCVQWPKVLNAPLVEVDPELYDIIEKEKNRQYKVTQE